MVEELFISPAKITRIRAVTVQYEPVFEASSPADRIMPADKTLVGNLAFLPGKAALGFTLCELADVSV